MEQIRLLREGEIKEFVEIVFNAYPGWGSSTPEGRREMEDRLLTAMREDSTVKVYGCFREGELRGGMRLNDFRMRLGSGKLDAGDLGLVAVHLMHKKEKVAKEIVKFFIRHYRDRKYPIAMLYPFRPDFYKKMGFGFGTKMNQYSIKPKDLPKGGDKSRVRLALEGDKKLILECYMRMAEKTNGMLDRQEPEQNNIFALDQNRLAIYERNGRVEGYIVFMFKKAGQDNALKNDIFIKEFVYENPEALKALLTFLNTQEDQIDRIIINTQAEDFHYMLMDPRNASDNLMTAVYHESNLQGVGIMYRVTDTRLLFESLGQHNFNNQSCRLSFNIRDSFLEENNGSVVVHFTEGRAVISDSNLYDAKVAMDIADFSSLVVGAVSFRTLLSYGIAGISDYNYAGAVDRIFEVSQKPICFTAF